MERMFKSLDFKNLVTVEKSRTTWVFEKVEIVIDDVTDLGIYIELEAKETFTNPKDGKTYLRKILKN